MGILITKVKVTLDLDRRRDKPFHFTVGTDGTEEDMLEMVGRALAQKAREGEISEEDAKRTDTVKIESADKTGYFATIVGDVGRFFKSL